tara:strand:- start:29525 stop:29725 length:201 start_codon:yes stop_codon:yes gene_type:complete
MAKKKTSKAVKNLVCSCDGHGFGAILLVIGIVFLAKELGIIPDIKLWPIILIILGLYYLASSKKTC